MEGIDKRTVTPLTTSLLILTVLIATSVYSLIFQPASDIWKNGARFTSGWYPIVHTNTNAFLIWHDGIFSFLEPAVAHTVTLSVLFLVFIAGTTTLLSLVQTLSTMNRTLIGSCLFVSLFLLLGTDVYTWSIIACIPLLSTFVFYGVTEIENARRHKTFAVLLALLTSTFAHSYSILTIFSAIVIALSIKRTLSQHFPLFRDKNDLFFIALLFIPWLLCLCLVPTPDFPAYSPLGHVVPDDGLPGNILPLFAPMPPVPVIDRITIRTSLYDWTIGLLCLSFILNLTKRNALSRLTLCFSLLLALDIVFPEWISQIAPLSTVQRLIPFLFFYPIQIPILGIAILMLTLSLVRTYPRPTTPLIAALIFLPILFRYDLTETSMGYLFSKQSSVLQKELSTFSAAPDFTEYVEQVVTSPSHAILKKTGLWPLRMKDTIQHWKFSSLLREKPTVSTHATGIEPVEYMFDRNIGTRWSPGGGAQVGNEWIYVFLPEPQLVQGLEIVTGPFHTDFARGIRVSVDHNCNERISDPSEVTLQTLISIPEWEGSLTITSDGFPYFGGQGGGRLYFKQPITVQCILIEQTATAKGFDWSIAELRTLKYPQ